MKTNVFIITVMLIITSLVFSTLVNDAQAQANLNTAGTSSPLPSWILLSTDPDMANRGMRAVYDSHRNVVVMFGGQLDLTQSFTNLTWEFDGTSWHQIDTPNSPPPRIWHGMAYDSNRQVVVVYGGEGESGNLFDTWEYDGSTWTQIVTPHIAFTAYGFGMTFDSCRNKVVLDSGGWGEEYTWEYDASDWQVVADSPSPNFLTALAFDSVRCRTVMFGGGNNETWEFDGITWEQVLTSQQPMSRWAHAMAYDPLRGRIVLFGGYGPEYPDGTQLGDTWEYDGTNWIETTPTLSPSPCEQHILAFEGHLEKVLLFGGSGSGETWLYDPTARIYLPLITR